MFENDFSSLCHSLPTILAVIGFLYDTHSLNNFTLLGKAFLFLLSTGSRNLKESVIVHPLEEAKTYSTRAS